MAQPAVLSGCREPAAPVAHRRTAESAFLRLAPLLPVLVTSVLVGGILLWAEPWLLLQDTWLALVSGRELVEHGLPTHDHLTVLAQGHRWIDQQWLGQLVLYGIWMVGGLSAVAAAGIVLALSAYGLAAAIGSRAGANPSVLTGLVLLAIAADPWALQVRTQELALPLYVVLLGLLLTDRRGERRRTLLVLPILALWANVHGSVALGALVVLSYGATLAATRRLGPALPYLLGAPLCLLVSPYGPSLPQYYWKMLVAPPFAGLVREWQRSWPSPYTAVFYALALVALAAVLRNPRRYEPFELVLLAVTFAVGVSAIRNIVWFALACLSVLPQRMTPRRALAGRVAAALSALAAVATVGIVAIALARPASDYTARGLTAEAARATVAALRGSGLVYADDAHADWLLWSVPSVRGRLAYDSRLELFDRPDLRRLAAIAARRGDYMRALRPYRLVVETPAPASALAAARWGRLIYEDDTTAIVARTSP